MLLQHLSELQEYELVGKKKGIGYPLSVEYFLTDGKGAKIIEAISIMQDLGAEYLAGGGEGGSEDGRQGKTG